MDTLILIQCPFTKNSFLETTVQNWRNGVYNNTLFLLFILYLLFTFNTILIILICPLTFIYTYFQKNLWVNFFEVTLTNLPREIRFNSLTKLLLDNCTITVYNIHKYVYAIISGEIIVFKKMIKSTFNDIKVFLGIQEPFEGLSENQQRLHNFEKKFFKYVKVINWNEDINTADEEEIKKIFIRMKRQLNPTERFNFLRKLPWKFDYKVRDNFISRNFITQFIIFYTFIKTVFIALVCSLIYFLYTIFFFKIQFLKQLAVWFIIGMLFFWLISGFNFFLKRYQYGKFTSQIQRFWKRTNTCFWLIEGFLISLFFYYYLNSSQEPVYMYDYSSLNQEYLISLNVIGVNIILLALIVYFMYFILLRINSNTWIQINLYLIILSSFVFFSFFIETYQFYYIISTFSEHLWVFNEEENMWGIDIDNPILRTKQIYMLVCLIAKYWHFLFIFLSWVFFLIKSFERKKITFTLYSANLQNIIILYVLNLVCYIQWLKWFYRRFFDLPYNWFFTNIDNKVSFRLFSEIKLLIVNLFQLNINFIQTKGIIYKSLLLWDVNSLAIWKFL